MPIYEFAPDRIQPLSKTTFGAMQLHERRDLQRLLRENIEVIAPDALRKRLIGVFKQTLYRYECDPSSA